MAPLSPRISPASLTRPFTLLLHLLPLLFLQCLNLPQVHGRCDRIAVRRSFVHMSEADRAIFLTAHARLNDPRSSRPNRFDYIVNKHAHHHESIHEGAIIFPWHRPFLAEYQYALHRIDPRADLPYWNWAEHGLYPETSPVFQGGPTWLGGDGVGPHRCVPDGALAPLPVFYTSYQFPTTDDTTTTTTPCLRRRFDKGPNRMSTWFEQTTIELWLTSSRTYAEFRALFEPPHWLVHTSIDGDMSSPYAPNDLLFFLHHAYMDKLWNDWMERDPSGARFAEYNGALKNGTPVSPDDFIDGFGDLRVRDVLNTTAHDTLCYTYD
ncbi:hypothetical protein H4R33_002073 [Dimargaris cristalligena]|uniref:Tyrosinase copper-binding domain-containing protein n=1 Tax=Dimargaris cristalligena TaxID=215637 RepID=A0A4P9ZNY3_9FUNG|nr:hypothetical protein H4R33_002073 [Dimargaris cristalligena]RKP35023.1 hypothetical protein BJ085DRAFT_27287 [Dimargaris cristalligena]|eukprot:RKP35023.1 hypothetical protein BJ085DRAFT_27287 [Dimargaris cristalligena]